MLDSGLILIDKEAGMTSRKVDNLIGSRFKTHKVGHLGTLDPFATGLLIVGVNKGTKFLPYLKDEEKTYVAELKLGGKTLSGDNTSEVIENKDVPMLTKDDIKSVLSSFLGESEQTPPMTSAKKIDGKPLYKLAHKGISIDRKPNKINVYEIELIEFDKENKIIKFVTTVSKGTYIRTLGEDIAEKLGTYGHLISLRRIAIGNINVKDAKGIDEANFVDTLCLFVHIEKHYVDKAKIQWVKDGKPLEIESQKDEILIVSESEPLAIYVRKEDNLFVSKRGLF